MFLRAMYGVVPLGGRGPCGERGTGLGAARRSGAVSPVDEGDAAVKALADVLSGKVPIPVRHTPEYVEGFAPGVHPDLVRKLHGGRFSVQRYCDLHGLHAEGAVETCAEFLGRAIVQGERCVGLIHGRGLSSPGGPVLKQAVTAWLSRGPLRRFVMAFSSAPAWDGGAGVTYVLLRRNPAKRVRRRRARGGC